MEYGEVHIETSAIVFVLSEKCYICVFKVLPLNDVNGGREDILMIFNATHFFKY